MLALLLGSAVAQARLMTVEDHLKIQSLGPIEVSAAGELATGRTVYEVRGRQDGSSVLSMRWSPDGSRLAYLRADRHGKVSLALWDAASGRSRTLVANSVRPFYPYVRWASSDRPAAAFAWIGAEEILFTQADDPMADALQPESALARARVGGNSVRVWQTSNVSMCRPFDRLATVRLNGTVREVARGPILAASLAPDASVIAVITAVKHLQPPRTAPLPAHLYSQPAADGTPFMQWELVVLTRQNGTWKPTGEPINGKGSITPDMLPGWKPDGTELAGCRAPAGAVRHGAELPGARGHIPRVVRAAGAGSRRLRCGSEDSDAESVGGRARDANPDGDGCRRERAEGHRNPRCEPAQVLARQMMHEYPGSSDLPPVNNLLMKMGGPPYELLEKYVRNSPLLNIRNASTPALIIQGSEDGFADGERLFNTLCRMGVDAELLYYWGEGHIVQGPANVRDMTPRTLDWVMARM